MNTIAKRDLQKELMSRGFKPNGDFPNETMTLDGDYLDEIDLPELLESMVARREKVFRSIDVVGEKVAKESYYDVVQAIDAIKVTINRLISP